eukprot:CAMPEP_0206475460 /NCGR_PEP_ID=MMETSP0324_2-20121206/34093_1 /ASSEMBLY_ACC=CAM_ASM_000836 /TAXON_ID=2866 /ORGANISM="Crypthecodinium cohnii, Strain Seligo" /LENGTH=414 /DNA_ID=CAMNT_0053950823 /DNA_START=46 /DNA_END=1290 /DNA_ORIENTATION=-
MAPAPETPVLRPSVGFCLQTVSSNSGSGRWFVNMTKHKLCELPIAYSGKTVSRDWILANGIGNMQVPFDIGSFRKLKERADGAKQTTYCIDVVFNPLIIQLFMDDEFCNKMSQYRPFVIGLALKRIEETVGVRLSQDKVSLVKTLRYKDGEGPEGNIPREFLDVPGSVDCMDEEAPKPAPKIEEVEAEPLIQDLTPGKTKPAMKKGFLNNTKGSLYGEAGSGEGVLPENAGDPLGYIPKKLRQTCKIVDCSNPEYQEQEKARKAAEESNKMNQDFRDEMNRDMEKWLKMSQPDKWNNDLPEKSAEPETKESTVTIEVLPNEPPEEVKKAQPVDYELNKNEDSLQLVVHVPGLESMQDVALDVTEKSASLSFPLSANLQALEVDLPSSVHPAKVKAKFSKKKGSITVTMPSLTQN